MNKELVSLLKEIVVKSGDMSLLARAKGLIIETKKDNSPVTNADKEISKYIYDNLTILTPSIPIICEEQTIVKIDKKSLFWLVDPIDGTRSYIKNKDTYTINIALINDGVPVMGFIYQPPLKKLYFTDENNNFCVEINKKKISTPKINDSFVVVVSSYNISAKTKKYIKENNFSKIIAIPSSIKLCMIAEGVVDVYPKFGQTMEWDIAAGHAILKTAGGEVLDINGLPLLYAKDNFCNPHFVACGQRWLARSLLFVKNKK